MTSLHLLPATLGRMVSLALLAAAVSFAAPSPTRAASAAEIDAQVDAAIEQLEAQVPGSKELANRSAAVLIFPKIVKAGFLLGVQGGQGALREHGKTEGYYESVAVSYGLQAGVESFGYALIFLDRSDLEYFRSVHGFELGSAPSLVVADQALSMSLSTMTMRKGILAFFFSERGLMGGAGVQGTKITRIDAE